MRKTKLTADLAMIRVLVHDYNQDSNGNPTAHHNVYGYRNLDQAADSPTASLFISQRRQQVGYGGNRQSEWAERAMVKGGVDPEQYALSYVTGERRDIGGLWLHYVRKDIARHGVNGDLPNCVCNACTAGIGDSAN